MGYLQQPSNKQQSAVACGGCPTFGKISGRIRNVCCQIENSQVKIPIQYSPSSITYCKAMQIYDRNCGLYVNSLRLLVI